MHPSGVGPSTSGEHLTPSTSVTRWRLPVARRQRTGCRGLPQDGVVPAARVAFQQRPGGVRATSCRRRRRKDGACGRPYYRRVAVALSPGSDLQPSTSRQKVSSGRRRLRPWSRTNRGCRAARMRKDGEHDASIMTRRLLLDLLSSGDTRPTRQTSLDRDWPVGARTLFGRSLSDVAATQFPLLTLRRMSIQVVAARVAVVSCPAAPTPRTCAPWLYHLG